ncbi:DUF2141 domain-containing protein [Vibrio sp. ZSDE26]|uniref:DUF2141 domain-containing protein n=1 Tax=Vibrio amylolyticus TaxID=2847292 RepID=A0A9X1XL13_9VIBR|nr:DUF2141 domain-containing protein [Vibrio amylolyticus]MCK6263853.1 DUF2141 domain-containing protein [Vibrio amylolyticus]
MMSTTISTLASEIKVTGIEHKRGGNIIVFIFSNEGFPKQHELAIQQQTQRAQGDTMTFHFDVNEQEVAIKVLHDEDENGKVTKNWTGIYPAEGLGFSNKQKVSLTGAPIYKRSKIKLADLQAGLTIEMNYP